MSRSYRKHFWFPTEGDKRNKKWFNRKLRHKHVGNGAEYKKQNNSRDIHCFWIHYANEESLDQARNEYNQLRELVYDMLEDEERGHNDDLTFYEHVKRANELGIEWK